MPFGFFPESHLCSCFCMLAVIFLLYLAPDTVSLLNTTTEMAGIIFLQLSLCVELHVPVY